MTPSAPSSQPAWFCVSICEPASIDSASHVGPGKNVPDAVNGGVEASLTHLFDQPLSNKDILLGQRRAMDTSLETADGPQILQIPKYPLRVDHWI